MTLNETIDGLCDQMGLGDPVLMEAIGYLRDYQSLLSDMSAKGIKMVTLGPK